MERWEVKLIGGTLGLIFGLLFVAMFVGNRVSAVSAFAEIEQLRKDVKKVDSKSAEDVLGQVTQINQEISAIKAWRKTMVGFMWPSSWNAVNLIDIPDNQTKQ